jgi:hypothetical protein
MRLTPKLAEALTNLRGDPYFAVVLEGMAEHEQEETTRCRDGDGPVLYRAQGAAKAIEWWRSAFREAPAALDKFRSQIHPSYLQGRNTP